MLFDVKTSADLEEWHWSYSAADLKAPLLSLPPYVIY
jgi:hypothetical protein